jgi:cytochrome P450
MLLRLGRVPTVVVSSAAGAEEVMRARDLDFASRPRSAMADRLLYGSRDVAFAPYGEYWRQARRVCALHLLSARRVASFRRVREQEAAALVARVEAATAGAGGGGAAIDLSELLTGYANAVVSRAAFGDECARGMFGGGDRGREQVRKVLTDLQMLLGTQPVGELLPWLGWVVDAARGLEAKITRTFEALDGLLDKVIDDHRRRRPSNGDHRDFVDVLLDVHNHEKEHGIQLDTNEIKAIVLVRTSSFQYLCCSSLHKCPCHITLSVADPSVSWVMHARTGRCVGMQDMFSGGTDTTTSVMEWAMAELVTHPRAMRRLQHEIRAAIVGSTTTTGSVVVGEGHLAQLGYLKAVVKETLRLHAPLPLAVPREAPEDAEIQGYHIPARTRVVINAWAIGRDPTTWEDAEEFLPERFSGGSAVDYRGQHFELVPFGAGRRGCPGVGLAEASIELALTSLLYHFDWEAPGGKTGPSSLDMTEINGISVHIKSALKLVAKPWIPSTVTTTGAY